MTKELKVGDYYKYLVLQRSHMDCIIKRINGDKVTVMFLNDHLLITYAHSSFLNSFYFDAARNTPLGKLLNG